MCGLLACSRQPRPPAVSLLDIANSPASRDSASEGRKRRLDFESKICGLTGETLCIHFFRISISIEEALMIFQTSIAYSYPIYIQLVTTSLHTTDEYWTVNMLVGNHWCLIESGTATPTLVERRPGLVVRQSSARPSDQSQSFHRAMRQGRLLTIDVVLATPRHRHQQQLPSLYKIQSVIVFCWPGQRQIKHIRTTQTTKENPGENNRAGQRSFTTDEMVIAALLPGPD